MTRQRTRLLVGALVVTAGALLLALPANPLGGHPDENGLLDIELATRDFDPDHVFSRPGSH